MDTHLLSTGISTTTTGKQQQQQLTHKRSNFSITKEFNTLSRKLSFRKITNKHRKFLTNIFSKNFQCGRTNDTLNETTSTMSLTYLPALLIIILLNSSYFIQAQAQSQVKNETTTAATPILRPSIEEVASDLSRKHLNLEHENWRLKQQIADRPQDGTHRLGFNSTTVASTNDEVTEFNEPPVAEAEQDIKLQSPFSSGDANRDQYTSERDSFLSVSQPPFSKSSSSPLAAVKATTSNRRKKSNMLQLQENLYEDNELHHCYQYLQKHNSLSGTSTSISDTPSSSSSSSAKSFSQRMSTTGSGGQQIPCLCEKRKHFSDNDDFNLIDESSSSIWLSCDNVQLIGNYFNPTTLNADIFDINNNADNDNGNNNKFTNNTNDLIIGITRFSQRDAGLQILNSQKFHYLKLAHLKSIDLSNNRIRQMKMDLFHGLEDKLEYLNLANNLLGDFRVVFDKPIDKLNSNNLNNFQQRTGGGNMNEKLLFNSDELNSLKKLKWLSLRNNQISKLSSSIFSINELIYLDLSENLLKFIPSESIQQLSKLKTLNLSKNRIIQLDESSKFPNSITYLDLSENLIKTVRHCNLIDLPNLVEINLSHNQLSHLDKTAFLSSSSLILNNLIPPIQPESSSSSSHLNSHSSLNSYHVSNILNTANLLNNFDNDQSSKDDSNDAYREGGQEEATLKGRLIIRGKKSDVVNKNRKEIEHQVERDYRLNDNTSYLVPSLINKSKLQKRNVGNLPPTSGGNIESESSKIEMFNDKTSNINDGDNANDNDDLESDESILSSTASRINKARQETIASDELNESNQQVLNQFSSTLKLNLSYNFFEQIPGDSLLKFTNLQQLDLSYNRIRRLDSNYLCSIYNLVENIRYLDLSGNLLTTSTLNQNSSDYNDGRNNDIRLLNRLFGCLQKLEKLLLSANRLASNDKKTMYKSINVQLQERSQININGDSIHHHHHHDRAYNQNDRDVDVGDNGDDLLVAESTSAAASSFNEIPFENERLTIRFGESFASKNLNTLDLSDNQLKSMPIIEQASNQATLSLFNSTSVNSNNLKTTGETTTTTNNNVTIQQLNQWANSAVYLNVLNLNYNYLEKLNEHDFEQLYNLRQLFLDYNKISTLPVSLMRKFTGLEMLSLNGNKISSLDPLNELFERSIKTLKVFNMANNRLVKWPQINKQLIKEIEPTSSYNQEFNKRTLDTSLRIPDPITTTDNQKQQQQQNLYFALEELNLEGNLLTSGNLTSLFDQLIYMKSLKTLNLSFNLINKIRSEWFKFANNNLQKLLLNGNKINNIELGSFTLSQVNNLIQLNLDYNLLKELKRKTFDSLPNLKELNLAFNSIHTINSETFHQINSLQILKLNNNKLTSWKCEYFSNLCNSITGNINADLTTLLMSSDELRNNRELIGPNFISSLTELDLSYNSISQLRTNSISVHTKLIKLNLEHNKLSFIPHDLFKATTSSLKTGRQIQLISNLKYIKLAHNNIQTIDNINFKPLKNLLSLDLSFNELQTLGIDVILLDDTKNSLKEQNNRKVIISNNITNLLIEDEILSSPAMVANLTGATTKSKFSQQQPAHNWPSLSKLRHLNLSHNQLTTINQSMLSELSPLALLNLDLSFNLLESDSLPSGFFTKITGNSKSNHNIHQTQQQQQQQQTKNYDLVFSLKLESLDLSHNRLSEYPTNLLENHYTSIESCDLSYNRIQNLIANSNLMIQIKKLNLKFNPLNRESNELILFEQRNVRHLNLAATRLYAIQQVTMSNSDSILSNLHPSQIKYRIANQTSQLDLIRSINRPIDAPYLRHLNLSSNQLVWLAGNVFDKMHSLQTLDLSNNQLTRLHLLNNQLLYVSPTLEYLNIASNLFTNIDLNDFNQLSSLQYLDLSNLLSMQKMNCKFLSKLTALKTLKMFNYPQLRQTLNNLMNTLNSNSNNNQLLSGRLERKIRNELIMSTIGQHCFEDEQNQQQESNSYYSTNEDQSLDPINIKLKWFNIEQLELELFNRFNDLTKQQQPFSGSFKLQDELTQLVGPKTKRISLNGLNITSLSDDSLLGITNDELQLKISYTSLSQLPLKQILNSVTKKTKLVLDFRNNNIQSIDMKALQLLDELQINNQLVQNGDHSSLKLGLNPIRCDCQTRPLWLWLNRRLENVDLSSIGSDEQLGDTSPTTRSSYYKFNSISETSDLKCYFPLKLRGKLTQHVNYNDLVCKGDKSVSGSNNVGKQSRKRNETTYYLTSGNLNDDFDELDEDDYIELDQKSENLVKLTKFNRYRQTIFNNSFYLVNFASFQTHDLDMSPSLSGLNEDSNNRIGKRDQNSDPTKVFSFQNEAQSLNNQAQHQQQQQQVNINYNKYRPNTHQRHTPINILNAHFNQLPINHIKAMSSKSGTSKHALLTDSDVYILTIISIAMSVMSFIIISICLFKYKMDRNDKENIFSAQSKFMSQSLFLSADHRKSLQSIAKTRFKKPRTSESGGESSSCSSKNSKKNSTDTDSKGKKSSKSGSSHGQSQQQQTIPASRLMHSSPPRSHQVIVPINQSSNHLMAPVTQNFMIRSPTIRRMQGLATNASDWFKFTLRAYPTNSGGRSRKKMAEQLFVDSKNRSQLATAQFAATQMRNKLKYDSYVVPEVLVQGCPVHKFDAIQKLKNNSSHLPKKENSIGMPILEEQCLDCNKLLISVQQTKVQYMFKATQDETTSSSDITSTNNGPSLNPKQNNKNIKSKSKKYSHLAKILPSSPTSSSSSSYTPHSSQIVKKNYKLNSNDSKQSTSEQSSSNNQQPYYISPKLIRALAKQLDEQHENEAQQTEQQLQQQRQQQQQQQQKNGKEIISGRYITINNGEQSKQANKFSSAYHIREQQAKSMKTFGVQQSTKNQQQQQQVVDINEHLLLSQIPATYVDGRFNYQTESQLDVVSADGRQDLHHCSDSEATTTATTTRGEMTLVSPLSEPITDQEDVFILIHDSSSVQKKRACLNELMKTTMAAKRIAKKEASSSSSASGPALVGTSTEERIYSQESRDNINRICDNDNMEVNSIMNDECSQSSSPIAYGFMRSSPSVTTLSSHATNHNQYTVNNSPNKMVFSGTNDNPYEQCSDARNSIASSNDDNNNNNDSNNNDERIADYSMYRKGNNIATIDANNEIVSTIASPNQPLPTKATTLSDDQIIISRL